MGGACASAITHDHIRPFRCPNRTVSKIDFRSRYNMTRVGAVDWVELRNDTYIVFGLKIRSPKTCTFTPGQYCKLSFPTNNSKTSFKSWSLSLLSAPPLSSDLQFIVKQRRALHREAHPRTVPFVNTLCNGAPLYFEACSGNIAYSFQRTSKERRPHLMFIAGGVGIAPFVFIIRHLFKAPTSLTEEIYQPHVCMLHSVAEEVDLVFHDELRALSSSNPKFSYYYTITRRETDIPPSEGDIEQAPSIPNILSPLSSHPALSVRPESPVQVPDQAMVSPRHCAFWGRITPSMLANISPNPDVPTWFICGPLAMVRDVQQMLKDMSVDERRIVSD